MLQEWLEELAEDEIKKTASSKLEEGLNELSVDELKGFINFEKDAQYTQQVPAGVELDPERARTQGRLMGGVGGAALGGMAGSGIGQAMGGTKGAIAGGVGGAALGALGLGAIGGSLNEAVSRRELQRIQANQKMLGGGGGQPQQFSTAPPREMDQDEMMGYLSQIGDDDDFASAYESPSVLAAKQNLLKQNPGMQENDINMHPDVDRAVLQHMVSRQQMPKQASKTKMAIDAGRALAYAMSKQAQTPTNIEQRTIQAAPVDRQQWEDEFTDQTKKEMGVGAGAAGAGLGGIGLGALGDRIGSIRGAAAGSTPPAKIRGGMLGGTKGRLIGTGLGMAGGALAGYGLGAHVGEPYARDLAETMGDDEVQARADFDLANNLYGRGQISANELDDADRRLEAVEGLNPRSKTASFKETIMKAAQKGAISKYEWEL